MEEKDLRAQMVKIAGRMYARDFISGLAGNLSARLPDGNFLATPGGVCKEELEPDDLLVVDLDGNCLRSRPGMRPTSELPMHLEIYRQRSDVGGVIHAHPIACVALSLVGISLEEPRIPEALVSLGPVPTTQYATPSSTENRDAIAGLIADHDCIILAHHGSLTVGRDLREAYLRLEILEHTAQAIAMAYQIGQPRSLTPEAVAKLLKQREQLKSQG